MATSRKKTFDPIEIDEISDVSESGLEPQLEGLDMSSTDDEETYVSASNVQKRRAP